MTIDIEFIDNHSGEHLDDWNNYPVIPTVNSEVLINSKIYTVDNILYDKYAIVRIHVSEK